jgi:hypothetical protein
MMSRDIVGDNSNMSRSYIRGQSSKVNQADVLDAVTSIRTLASSIDTAVNGVLSVTAMATYTTDELLSAETVADGASVTSSVLDLGEESALADGISLFLDMSDPIVTWDLQVEVSPDNALWYSDASGSFTFTDSLQNVVLNVEETFGSAARGSRYYRFTFYNNDGAATSTDVTLRAAAYR